jgi:ArsR family transcriptional regulator
MTGNLRVSHGGAKAWVTDETGLMIKKSAGRKARRGEPGFFSLGQIASCRPDEIVTRVEGCTLDMPAFLVTKFLVMTNVVTISRALADETRWRIVRLAMDDALCVCELADILGMPQSSASSHVQIIRRAGLLEEETCGKWTYFRIARPWLPLLRKLAMTCDDASFFPDDAVKAARRLAERENSCCRGPRKLTTRRKVTP